MHIYINYPDLILLIIAFLSMLYILNAVSNVEILTKAGEKGYKGVIPVYGHYSICKISIGAWAFWIEMFLIILLIATDSSKYGDLICRILNILAGVGLICIRYLEWYILSLAFGHRNRFAFGLLLAPVIFKMILAFGKNEYDISMIPDEYLDIYEEDCDDIEDGPESPEAEPGSAEPTESGEETE